MRLPNILGHKKLYLPDPHGSLKGSSESNKTLNLFNTDAGVALTEEEITITDGGDEVIDRL